MPTSRTYNGKEYLDIPEEERTNGRARYLDDKTRSDILNSNRYIYNGKRRPIFFFMSKYCLYDLMQIEKPYLDVPQTEPIKGLRFMLGFENTATPDINNIKLIVRAATYNAGIPNSTAYYKYQTASNGVKNSISASDSDALIAAFVLNGYATFIKYEDYNFQLYSSDILSLLRVTGLTPGVLRIDLDFIIKNQKKFNSTDQPELYLTLSAPPGNPALYREAPPCPPECYVLKDER